MEGWRSGDECSFFFQRQLGRHRRILSDPRSFVSVDRILPSHTSIQMETEAPQKAQSLSAALNLLDPERPLRTSEELRQFFVQRPHSPIDEIEILLDRSQRELLRAVHMDKDINNDEVHRELLHNLSVLEYKNDTVWYDVHPIILPLIQTDAESD